MGMPDNFVKNVNERLKVADSETEYATKETVDAEFAKCAKVAEFKGLQGTVQRMQADNISSAATFVKRTEAEQTFAANDRLQLLEERMDAMQKEYEAKLEAMQKVMHDEVAGIVNKLQAVKTALSD